MSSQGPVGTTTKSPPPFCTGPTGGTTGSSSYVFSTASIRDGSDWIAYKKQTLILNESSKKLKEAFPEISYGNDYRLQFLLGKYKNSPDSGAAGCNGCNSTPALISGRASLPSGPM